MEDSFVAVDERRKYRNIANKLINNSIASLSEEDRDFLDEYFKKIFIKTDFIKQTEKLTFSQKLADRIAKFGGSWLFIIMFLVFIAGWIVLNLYLLFNPLDPFPFILLNLFLSLIAALQAPIIMMSQNRLAEQDRTYQMYEFKINTKAEIEIQGIHQEVNKLNKKLNIIIKKIEAIDDDDEDENE
jgi:uncharacterized membrane protein